MLVIFGMLFGAICGGLFAKRRGGKRFDIIQYAIAIAILCGVIGMFATIIVERSL